jgi:Ca-activated chloride channel family protein
MDPELLAAMTVGRIGNPSYENASVCGRNATASYDWRSSGLLAGWLIAVVAIAGPTWRPEPSPFADDPVPVMLALKADETMDLSDLAPSRMERARLKIADFADERKGQPLGLIAYAGSAHLVLPPTRDTSVVATMASEISPAIMPERGDDLVGALNLAARTLGEARGSIVVLADTVPSGIESALEEFHTGHPVPVHFLAVARADTPELDAIEGAASPLRASVTQMTADSSDVAGLVRRTAKVPLAVAAAGEGTRWAEAGWWLVPVLALLSLAGFRRAGNSPLEEAAA